MVGAGGVHRDEQDVVAGPPAGQVNRYQPHGQREQNNRDGSDCIPDSLFFICFHRLCQERAADVHLVIPNRRKFLYIYLIKALRA